MTAKKTYQMTYIALFTVFITICSWISIPMVVPLTMQTFAIFFTMAMLGGIGVLLNTTGGYIIGFIFSALLIWEMEKIAGRKTLTLAFSMVLG